MKRAIVALLLLVFSCISAQALSDSAGVSGSQQMTYEEAIRRLASNRIDELREAVKLFSSLNLYRDSNAMKIYAQALLDIEEGKYDSAIISFTTMSRAGFMDSAELLMYAEGRRAEAAEDYETAYQKYYGLKVRDSFERSMQVNLLLDSQDPTPAPTIQPTPSPSPTAEPTVELTPAPYMSIAQYPYAPDIIASKHYVSSSHPEKNWRYLPNGAADMDLGSSWTVRSPKGEWLELRVTDGQKYQLAGFRMINGLLYGKNTFAQNARILQLNVYCDGQLVETVVTRDTANLETYWLREPVQGSVFRFEIESYVKGYDYSDCGICELELLGVNDTGFRQPDISSFGEWGAAARLAGQTAMRGDVLKSGSPKYAVMGLQVLLREGFGVLQDGADGTFGPATESALRLLMQRIQQDSGTDTSLTAGSYGSVDQATWKLMIEYMDLLRTQGQAE